MAIDIPAFEATRVADIAGKVSKLRATFNTQKTKDVQFRLVQLRKLYWGIKDHEAELAEACKRDLGKPYFEAQLADIAWVENDAIFVANNLEKWAKDEKAPDIPLMNSLLKPRIRKDPLGCVLIIGAFNFPVQLSIGPMIGAIAGGNTVVLKPSEGAPASAAVMQKIIEEHLDPECYTVIQGGIPETTTLLEQKWDKIFYTGSDRVGKIIAKAAAPTLTPVTLELGGRNPAIVTKNADVRLAARRLLWGKIMNAGQVCVSQNYILADRDIVPGLVAELKTAMAEFFPNGVKASPDYGRIVSPAAFRRIKAMLDNSRGKILIGGTMDEKENFIEPTVVQVSSTDDSLLTDESFGPLIPILPVTNLDEAIRIANEIHATPLGLYPFGSKKETDRVLNEVRSGGASVNDAFFHASIPTLAFGGTGDSGQGAYRGKASFDCFVHRRSVTTTPGWMEKMLNIRYPPYEGKFAKFAKMTNLKPNFDREGKVKFNPITWILTLGSGSAGSGAARVVAVLLVAFSAKQYLDKRTKA